LHDTELPGEYASVDEDTKQEFIKILTEIIGEGRGEAVILCIKSLTKIISHQLTHKLQMKEA
jgi:hypothetical protein